MAEQETKDADIELLENHITQLMEHFDTVHIFVTRHEGNNCHTVRVDKGAGNWYAKYGQIKLWTKVSEADEVKIDNSEE